MRKYHDDEHDFRLGHGGITAICTLCDRFKRMFYHHGIKKLQKSSAVQDVSKTLLSVILAIAVRDTL